MNIRSHIMMGNLLYDCLLKTSNVPLKRSLFVFGNIRPDIYPGIWADGHTKDNFLGFVKSEFEQISKINLARSEEDALSYSLRLGVLCHYMTDFFCYPHNADFGKGIVAHYIYEKKLCHYLHKRSDMLRKTNVFKTEYGFINAQEMAEQIEHMHKDYMENRTYWGYDISYAVEICLNVCASLLFMIEAGTLRTFEAMFNEKKALLGQNS